jgi:ubiquinone/menaquinone biosynthesis C-methylase UbiE
VDGRGPSTTETWDAFFSDFYLRAHGASEPAGQAEEQALAVAALARVPAGGAILDVPCGFGRHAIALAGAGFRVTGVDRSATLLAEARRRAAEAGVEPELVAADYRELPLPAARFDAAINLFTSLGYLGDEEDTRVLSEIARVLRPGGRLVVELSHRDRLVRGFREQDWHMVGEGRVLLEQRTFDVRNGVAQTTQTLIEPSGARESQAWSVRVYTATELVAMLRAAGFAEARCYGDLHGGPLTTSSRLVVVATRDEPAPGDQPNAQPVK